MRSFWLGLLPALALVPLFAACSGNGQSGGPIIANGHIEATEVRLAAKVGGRLLEFPVREGNVVTIGQHLGRIDTKDQELALAVVEADRAAAAADLRLKEAGYRKEEIAEARAAVAQLEADLAGAQREFDRFQGLLDSGSGTGKARDDAQTRRDVTARALEAARQRLARLTAGFRAEEIDLARARVQSTEARAGQLRQQIADAELVAPAPGVVTQKLVEEGELLASGMPLLVIVRRDDTWLTAYVGERDLGRIRIGDAADVVTDDGQRRAGTIGFIAEQAEFTPKNVQTREERTKLVYRIKVVVPNGDGLFKPGMPAEAQIAARVGR